MRVSGRTEKLVDENGTLLGEVCHICGDKLGSKRYVATQSEAERQSFSNLILLCPTHHAVIDSDEVRFSASILRRMKKHHEDKASAPFFISEKTAERVVLILGGAVAGVGLSEIAKGLGHLFGTIAGTLGGSPKSRGNERRQQGGTIPEKTLREVGEILRYAPKGTFAVYAERRSLSGICNFFARLFAANGWRQVEFVTNPDFLDKKSLCMVFDLNDPHQVSNAKQAIDAVFEKFKFMPVGSPESGESLVRKSGLRVYIFVGSRL